MRQIIGREQEHGATAMIVVLFSTLLFTVITVGFMGLMVQDQRASSDTELSRGAYDAALAGVEDGKRVLQKCVEGDTTTCDKIDAYKDTTTCSIVSDSGIAVADPTTKEVTMQSIVASGLAGGDYQQAYTCVHIQPKTKDFVGSLGADSSTLVPLRTVGPINKVVVRWFMRKNATSNTVNLTTTPSFPLPGLAAWGTTTSPPILRVQLMQYQAGDLKVADFDGNGGSHVAYLYPKKLAAVPLSFASDGRRSGMLQPLLAACNTSFIGNGGYACTAEIDLPSLPRGGNADQRVAYLRLTSLYQETDFSVSPLLNATSVMFDGVQPIIDSTGRAADVFRRVSARVENTDPLESMLLPRATVDITGNFCKTFSVSILASDYTPGSCTP